jgi:hypothetical protein
VRLDSVEDAVEDAVENQETDFALASSQGKNQV